MYVPPPQSRDHRRPSGESQNEYDSSADFSADFSSSGRETATGREVDGPSRKKRRSLSAARWQDRQRTSRLAKSKAAPPSFRATMWWTSRLWPAPQRWQRRARARALRRVSFQRLVPYIRRQGSLARRWRVLALAI